MIGFILIISDVLKDTDETLEPKVQIEDRSAF